MNRLTCSIPEAGLLFELSNWGSYEAAKKGVIPTIPAGIRKMRVPIAALAEKLGVDREDVLNAIDEAKAKTKAKTDSAT